MPRWPKPSRHSYKRVSGIMLLAFYSRFESCLQAFFAGKCWKTSQAEDFQMGRIGLIGRIMRGFFVSFEDLARSPPADRSPQSASLVIPDIGQVVVLHEVILL